MGPRSVAGVHAVTGIVIRLARCPVCNQMHATRGSGPGCEVCLARFGVKFVALADLFRSDPEFRRGALAKAPPRLLDALYQYLVDPPLVVPKRVPRSPFDH